MSSRVCIFSVRRMVRRLSARMGCPPFAPTPSACPAEVSEEKSVGLRLELLHDVAVDVPRTGPQITVNDVEEVRHVYGVGVRVSFQGVNPFVEAMHICSPIQLTVVRC